MLTFRKNYFVIFAALFIIEVLIALYVHDKLIRPYLGDVLVVILLYCLIKSFIKIQVLPAALAVLLFSFLIEGLQYIDIVNRMGLGGSRLARIVIGTSFSREDILAYITGFVAILLTERLRSKRVPDL